MDNKRKETRIFALVCGNEVFVGRSRADRLSGVVYGHLRGDHKQTKAYFDKEEKRPELYVLESVEGPSALVYRNWLAWIHIFDQSDYIVINRREVLAAARNLHYHTKLIVDRLSSLPLQEYLENGYKERYTDADRVTNDVSECVADKNAPPTVTLSVRMTPGERKLIQNFAAERDLSLRMALQYMAGRVAVAEGKTVKLDESLQKFQESYQKLAQTYKDQNGLLKMEIKNLREEKRMLQKRSAKRVEQMQEGIRQFMGLFYSSSRIPLGLEKVSYHAYMRETERDYHYPTEQNGFAVVRPQALLYGKGTVRFVVAMDRAGKGLKLRYYPNKHMAGISLGNPEFDRRGSVWLVAWEAAEEDVRELCFALPLEILPKTDDPMEEEDEIASLLREVDSYN